MEVKFNDGSSYEITGLRIDDNHGRVILIGEAIPDDKDCGFMVDTGGRKYDFTEYTTPIISLADGEVGYCNPVFGYVTDADNEPIDPSVVPVESADEEATAISASKNAADIEYMAMILDIELE